MVEVRWEQKGTVSKKQKLIITLSAFKVNFNHSLFSVFKKKEKEEGGEIFEYGTVVRINDNVIVIRRAFRKCFEVNFTRKFENSCPRETFCFGKLINTKETTMS